MAFGDRILRTHHLYLLGTSWGIRQIQGMARMARIVGPEYPHDLVAREVLERVGLKGGVHFVLTKK